MSEMNGSGRKESYGAHFAIGREIVVYNINPTPPGLDDFPTFYDKVVRKWLSDRHVGSAHCFVAGNTLIVFSSTGMPGWSDSKEGISGLNAYLVGKYPVSIQALGVHTLETKSNEEAYAKK
jgi:hypothetical protein